MTFKEYLIAVDKEHRDTKTRLEKIRDDYAFSNNTVKVGDRVSDSSGTIEVEQIRAVDSRGSGSQCIYVGVMITKKGKQYLNGDTRCVWQSQMIKET